jgi:hypothetical protein
MQEAAMHASLNMLKLLLNHGGCVSHGGLLAHAAYSYTIGTPEEQAERFEVIRLLLDQGVPVDAYFLETQSDHCCEAMVFGRLNALHFAVHNGKRELVKLLLDSGTDRNLPAWSVTMTRGKELSPAELAKAAGFEDIVGLLENKGPDMSGQS